VGAAYALTTAAEGGAPVSVGLVNSGIEAVIQAILVFESMNAARNPGQCSSPDKNCAPMPKISVIIPSYNSSRTIACCLKCVLHQVVDVDYDIVVVDSSSDGTEKKIAGEFPDVRVIHLNEKTIPGKGRNIGAQHSRGEILAFTDSDCMPARDWLQNIVISLQSGKNIVGGSVENGRPESMISKAEYFIEFREFSPASPRRKIRFLPSCNFAIKREVFEQAGGFPDVRASEDTLFAHQLVKRGYEIWFDPKIGIKHLNRCTLRPYLANQYVLGKYSAVVRKILPMPGGFFIKIPYAFPVLPIIRTIRTLQFISRNSFKDALRQFLDFLAVYPIFLLGSCVWSFGFFKGARMQEEVLKQGESHDG
jgi:glycosyltransferase involved in cell wall biosynthesis